MSHSAHVAHEQDDDPLSQWTRQCCVLHAREHSGVRRHIDAVARGDCVDLTNMYMGPLSLQSITTLLAQNTALRELRLTGNGLDSNCVIILCRALLLQYRQQLQQGRTHLLDSDPSHTDTRAAATRFSDALPSPNQARSSLQLLDLSDNPGITLAAGLALVSLVQCTRSITSVRLQRTGVPAALAAKIALAGELNARVCKDDAAANTPKQTSSLVPPRMCYRDAFAEKQAARLAARLHKWRAQDALLRRRLTERLRCSRVDCACQFYLLEAAAYCAQDHAKRAQCAARPTAAVTPCAWRLVEVAILAHPAHIFETELHLLTHHIFPRLNAELQPMRLQFIPLICSSSSSSQMRLVPQKHADGGSSVIPLAPLAATVARSRFVTLELIGDCVGSDGFCLPVTSHMTTTLAAAAAASAEHASATPVMVRPILYSAHDIAARTARWLIVATRAPSAQLHLPPALAPLYSCDPAVAFPADAALLSRPLYELPPPPQQKHGEEEEEKKKDTAAASASAHKEARAPQHGNDRSPRFGHETPRSPVRTTRRGTGATCAAASSSPAHSHDAETRAGRWRTLTAFRANALGAATWPELALANYPARYRDAAPTGQPVEGLLGDLDDWAAAVYGRLWALGVDGVCHGWQTGAQGQTGHRLRDGRACRTRGTTQLATHPTRRGCRDAAAAAPADVADETGPRAERSGGDMHPQAYTVLPKAAPPSVQRAAAADAGLTRTVRDAEAFGATERWARWWWADAGAGAVLRNYLAHPTSRHALICVVAPSEPPLPWPFASASAAASAAAAAAASAQPDAAQMDKTQSGRGEMDGAAWMRYAARWCAAESGTPPPLVRTDPPHHPARVRRTARHAIHDAYALASASCEEPTDSRAAMVHILSQLTDSRAVRRYLYAEVSPRRLRRFFVHVLTHKGVMAAQTTTSTHAERHSHPYAPSSSDAGRRDGDGRRCGCRRRGESIMGRLVRDAYAAVCAVDAAASVGAETMVDGTSRDGGWDVLDSGGDDEEDAAAAVVWLHGLEALDPPPPWRLGGDDTNTDDDESETESTQHDESETERTEHDESETERTEHGREDAHARRLHDGSARRGRCRYQTKRTAAPPHVRRRFDDNGWLLPVCVARTVRLVVTLQPTTGGGGGRALLQRLRQRGPDSVRVCHLDPDLTDAPPPTPHMAAAYDAGRARYAALVRAWGRPRVRQVVGLLRCVRWGVRVTTLREAMALSAYDMSALLDDLRPALSVSVCESVSDASAESGVEVLDTIHLTCPYFCAAAESDAAWEHDGPVWHAMWARYYATMLHAAAPEMSWGNPATAAHAGAATPADPLFTPLPPSHPLLRHAVKEWVYHVGWAEGGEVWLDATALSMPFLRLVYACGVAASVRRDMAAVYARRAAHPAPGRGGRRRRCAALARLGEYVSLMRRHSARLLLAPWRVVQTALEQRVGAPPSLGHDVRAWVSRAASSSSVCPRGGAAGYFIPTHRRRRLRSGAAEAAAAVWRLHMDPASATLFYAGGADGRLRWCYPYSTICRAATTPPFSAGAVTSGGVFLPAQSRAYVGVIWTGEAKVWVCDAARGTVVARCPAAHAGDRVPSCASRDDEPDDAADDDGGGADEAAFSARGRYVLVTCADVVTVCESESGVVRCRVRVGRNGTGGHTVHVLPHPSEEEVFWTVGKREMTQWRLAVGGGGGGGGGGDGRWGHAPEEYTGDAAVVAEWVVSCLDDGQSDTVRAICRVDEGAAEGGDSPREACGIRCERMDNGSHWAADGSGMEAASGRDERLRFWLHGTSAAGGHTLSRTQLRLATATATATATDVPARVHVEETMTLLIPPFDTGHGTPDHRDSRRCDGEDSWVRRVECTTAPSSSPIASWTLSARGTRVAVMTGEGVLYVYDTHDATACVAPTRRRAGEDGVGETVRRVRCEPRHCFAGFHADWDRLCWVKLAFRHDDSGVFALGSHGHVQFWSCRPCASTGVAAHCTAEYLMEGSRVTSWAVWPGREDVARGGGRDTPRNGAAFASRMDDKEGTAAGGKGGDGCVEEFAPGDVVLASADGRLTMLRLWIPAPTSPMSTIRTDIT